jgi:hypothetical protein
MGEARRRKLLGLPPRNPKREKRKRMSPEKLARELFGDNPVVGLTALMLGAKYEHPHLLEKGAEE